MRIVHVATLLSIGGAFGGPISVAREQAAALAREGHDVTFLSGWDGHAAVPSLKGVKVVLVETRQVLPLPGFSGFFGAKLVGRLRREVRRHDVVHIHMGRDLTTTAAACAARQAHVPYVIQSHGMIQPRRALGMQIGDGVVTRPLLRGAAAVLSLTTQEDAALRAVEPKVEPLRLRNGVSFQPMSRPLPTGLPEVLFCARLHPRKRVLAFAEMARLLLAGGAAARFTVVGPDEGDLGRLRAYLEEHRLTDAVAVEGPMDPDAVRARLARSTIYVLPSVDEPYPMTVLEALAAGSVPVVTSSCHIAQDLQRWDAAVVSDPDPAKLADAVGLLLEQPARLAELQANAGPALERGFGMREVTHRLEKIYGEALSAS